MDILQNMIFKEMPVFSGAGPKGVHNFQAGAVGIASRLDDDAPLVLVRQKWQFVCLANKEVSYGEKENPIQL